MSSSAEQRFRRRVEEAVKLHRSGRRSEAIPRYRALRAEQPTWPPLLNLLGLALVQDDAVDEGLALLMEAVRRAPDFADAWLNLAFAQYEAGDRAAAEVSYRQLLKLQPHHVSGLLSLASLITEEYLIEATALVRRATEVAPDRALPWLRLRRLCVFHGDWAGIADADRRIESLRLEGEDLAELAAIEYESSRYEAAALLYRDALKQRPDLASAMLGLGDALRELGRYDEALAALRQCAAQAPRRFNPWTSIGLVYLKVGNREAAVQAFDEALQRNSEDHYTRHWRDAALGKTTAASSIDFVKRSSFQHAAIYDSVLVPASRYRAPWLMAERLAAQFPGREFRRLLDLGCGTGLVAAELQSRTRYRIGLDVSRRMLEIARRRGLYRELIEQEAVSYFASTRERFDLIAAADVLPYIADLAPLFEQVAAHLEPGGIFVTTTEQLDTACESGDYVLRITARYAHADTYLRRLATERGLNLVHLETIDLRREGERMLQGTLALFSVPG